MFLGRGSSLKEKREQLGEEEGNEMEDSEEEAEKGEDMEEKHHSFAVGGVASMASEIGRCAGSCRAKHLEEGRGVAAVVHLP
ncbi:hypothetical protein GW17_00022543 [Ensete ventricosum]|nr:hypothetical protein GW17_00022543 [Ensete ventricosum]